MSVKDARAARDFSDEAVLAYLRAGRGWTGLVAIRRDVWNDAGDGERVRGVRVPSLRGVIKRLLARGLAEVRDVYRYEVRAKE